MQTTHSSSAKYTHNKLVALIQDATNTVLVSIETLELPRRPVSRQPMQAPTIHNNLVLYAAQAEAAMHKMDQSPSNWFRQSRQIVEGARAIA